MKITEDDLRLPEFKGVPLEQLERRGDGKIVRKDRWEKGIKQIAGVVGFSRKAYEVGEVVEAVRELREKAIFIDEGCFDLERIVKLSEEVNKVASGIIQKYIEIAIKTIRSRKGTGWTKVLPQEMLVKNVSLCVKKVSKKNLSLFIAETEFGFFFIPRNLFLYDRMFKEDEKAFMDDMSLFLKNHKFFVPLEGFSS